MLHAAATHGADSSLAALKQLSIDELLAVDIEVTSVSRQPQRLVETAAAIQVITQQDIQRSGATSLPEALRLASNLEVVQINTRQWAVSARGLLTDTANELLVMIDGRSLYSPRVAGVSWDIQDVLLADIDRIEVISGPGATLWGANAVNGVINIITKRAQDTQGALLVAAAGSELQNLTGLRYGGSIGASDFHYRVYAKHDERDGVSQPDGTPFRSGTRSSQGGFRVDGAINQRDALTVQGDLYDLHTQQVASDDLVAHGGNVLGRWSRQVSASAELNLQVYYDHTFLEAPSRRRDSLDTYDVDFDHRFVWRDHHHIVWGVGYRRYDNSVRSNAAATYIPATQQLTVLSGFVQDNLDLFDEHLKLTFGSKFEHNDYSGFEVQPSVRAAWLPNSVQTLWAAVSRAVRTPSRNDRELYQPANPPYTRVGNDTFTAEELLAYELGYRLQPHPRLSFSVATFYDDYDKLRSIERVVPSSPTPTTVGNGQRGYSYGAELTADFYPTHWWHVHVADTEIRIRLRPRSDSTDFSYGANESFDPRQQFFVRSSFDLPRGWQFDAMYRHISRLSHQDTPAYGELDMRLAWQLRTNVTLSLTGQNLLHRRHIEYSSAAGARAIERSFYGKLLCAF